MYQVEKLTAKDCDELVEFLGRVFGNKYGRVTEFRPMFPRIMRPTDEMMGQHLAIRDNGKIIACCACYPVDYQMGEQVVRGAGAGNVAVDDNLRNQGLMRLVMEAADTELRERCDVSYLHGARRRYSYYHYERCGIEYDFQVSRPMIGKDDNTTVELKPLTEMEAAFEYYNRHCHFVRTFEDFVIALPSQSKQAFGVWSGDRFCGYVTKTVSNRLEEFYLDEPSRLAEVVKAEMVNNHYDSYSFKMSGLEPEYVNAAYEIAETWNTHAPAQFLISHLEPVVTAYLGRELAGTDISGSFTIDSDLFGKFEIGATHGEAYIRPFYGTAQYTLHGYEVYRFLFGTVRPSLLTGFAAAVLPIPLYLPYIN